MVSQFASLYCALKVSTLFVKRKCLVYSRVVCKLWDYLVIIIYFILMSFIVASLRHTCAIIMLSNQRLHMPHLWGGWIISAKEKCSLTQIYTDLWTIFERNRPFVYIEKVLDLWVQLMKNGGRNKSIAFIILVSVYIYIYISNKIHSIYVSVYIYTVVCTGLQKGRGEMELRGHNHGPGVGGRCVVPPRLGISRFTNLSRFFVMLVFPFCK